MGRRCARHDDATDRRRLKEMHEGSPRQGGRARARPRYLEEYKVSDSISPQIPGLGCKAVLINCIYFYS